MRLSALELKPTACGWSAVLTMAVVATLAPVPGAAQPASQPSPSAPSEMAARELPEVFGERFLQTFADKDFKTLRSLFAPGATVTGIWLADDDAVPETQPFEEWLKVVEEQTAALEWQSMIILEKSSIDFKQGTVVSLGFHAKGLLGGAHAFTNDGIETYTLTPDGESWKVLHYSYIEMMEMTPAAAAEAEE